MYDSMTRLKIKNLRSGGLTQAQTALAARVSERTVKRVDDEQEIEDPAAEDKKRSAKMGRPSKVKEHAEDIQRWLEENPRLPSMAIVERLREQCGYSGGKSAVFALVRSLRPPKTKEGIVRFESVPGEFSQHDFGHKRVRYQDGSEEMVHFFASSLKYSRMRRVTLVPDERLESVCHGLVDAFEYFGGVPLIAAFDNPKTIVKEHGKHGVKWNPAFAQFCMEAGICPHACAPYRPQEKGQVENLVGYIKSSFFNAHTFKNRAALEEKLVSWHKRSNDERVCRATKEIPRARLLLESGRLKPLGISPYGYRLRFSRVVRPDGFVEFEGLRYFASLKRVGQTINLRVGAGDVLLELEEGCDAVVHPRVPQNGKYSILPFQREEQHTKRGARPFAKRQLLMDLCPAAHWLITEIRHRRPAKWEREIDDLYLLLEQYGDAVLAKAMKETAVRELVGAEYVKALLLEQAEPINPATVTESSSESGTEPSRNPEVQS